MFTKNYLTRNLKSLLIYTDVKCSKRRDLTRLNVSGVLRQQLPLVQVSRRGAFVVPNYLKNQYELTTTRKKTSLGKLVNNTLKKYINYILSQFKRLVKGKIADMYFKPKSPVFLN